MTQLNYHKKINKLPPDCTFQQFRCFRGQLSWITSLTRPDLACMSAVMSQVTELTMTIHQVNLANKAVKRLLATPTAGLTFPPLDQDSLRFYVCSDASFASNEDESSQLAIVALLADRHGQASVIHYKSWKCDRITRSILAAEVHAFAAAFDFSYTLQQDVNSMLRKEIPLHMFTDSKSLFDTITRLTGLKEKRFLIDVKALRQSHKHNEMFNIGHVLSDRNLADPLSKNSNVADIQDLMETGRHTPHVNEWLITLDDNATIQP